MVVGVGVYAVGLLGHVPFERASLVAYLPVLVVASVVLGLAVGRWPILLLSVVSAPALLFIEHETHVGFATPGDQALTFLLVLFLPTCIGVAVRHMWSDLGSRSAGPGGS